MAIPTTQKECTTRRIASLIIGLWAKIKNAFLLKTSRGAANGVASLDANGKVPTSQLPTVPTGNLPANSSSSAGIVASGSGQNKKVWMTDSSGNPSWRTVGEVDINGIMRPEGLYSDRTYYVEFLRINTNNPQLTSPGCEMTITCRAGNTGIFRLYAQFGDYMDATTHVRIIRLMNKNTDEFNLKFYRTVVTDGFVKFYFKTSSNQFIHWWMDHNPQPAYFSIQNNQSTTAPSGELIELPIDGEQVYANGQVGSVNTPVYVNSNGAITPCNKALTDKRNFPKLNFFYNGGNDGETNQYIKVANITCSMGYLNRPFIFRCLSRYQSMYTINIMFQSGNITRPGLLRFNVEVPIGFSASTADVKITYDDSGTYRVYTLWVNPGSWTGVSTVLECEDQFASLVQITNEQYSTSLTDPVNPQYIKYAQSITPGSRIGNESTPIFMEDTGTLRPCTNIPVIEHVTTIPVNPTVGTIYAL